MHLKIKNLEEKIDQAIDKWNQGLVSASQPGIPEIKIDMGGETEAQRKAREAEEQRKREQAA